MWPHLAAWPGYPVALVPAFTARSPTVRPQKLLLLPDGDSVPQRTPSPAPPSAVCLNLTTRDSRKP